MTKEKSRVATAEKTSILIPYHIGVRQAMAIPQLPMFTESGLPPILLRKNRSSNISSECAKPLVTREPGILKMH